MLEHDSGPKCTPAILTLTHFNALFLIEEKLKNNTYILESPCHFDFQLPRYWSNTT